MSIETRSTYVIELEFTDGVPRIEVELSKNSVYILNSSGQLVYEPEVAFLLDKFDLEKVQFLMIHIKGMLTVYKQHNVDYSDDTDTYSTKSMMKLVDKEGFFRFINIEVYGTGDLANITLKWEETNPDEESR